MEVEVEVAEEVELEVEEMEQGMRWDGMRWAGLGWLSPPNENAKAPASNAGDDDDAWGR